MFAEVLNGKITHYRGDTLSTPIRIFTGSKLYPVSYTLKPTDKLYFGVMEPNQSFENAILKKVFDYESSKDSEGNTLLLLKSTDTEKMLVGKYYYMIKLKTVDKYNQEAIETLVTPTLFWLNGNNDTFEEDSFENNNQPDNNNQNNNNQKYATEEFVEGLVSKKTTIQLITWGADD
jgi:hypothetical protein